MPARTIALIGALDTKGRDFAFVRELIERRGHRVLLIDFSVTGVAQIEADIPSERLAEAGGSSLTQLREKGDKSLAMEVMTRGASAVARELFDAGRFDAMLAMGGTAGTAVGASAMRALPIGVPKVLVSTVAAGDTSAYVDTRDITLMPSVTDVAGVNRISAKIYANAAGAVCGMAETEAPAVEARPLLAASMFGNTTQIVDRCCAAMERAGFETLVFHCTGLGGRTMESLVAEGYVSGVLDITTTEWADELLGGVFAAGPQRGDAAGERGIPQVVAPGCVDMANFWAPETVPAKYADRLFYRWNPNVTLMRTAPEENAEIGRILAEKANASRGPVAFFLPLKGVSQLDSPGEAFWLPEADAALFDAIKANVREGIDVIELDHNINDDAFADAMAEGMLRMLAG